MLHDATCRVYLVIRLIEAEHRMMVARGCGKEEMGDCLVGSVMQYG